MKITLLEDEMQMALLAKQAIKKLLGLELNHFPTPAELLAQDVPADLYLIDWDQPDETGAGKRVIQELTLKFPEARFIVVSGNISEVPSEARELDIPFVAKPYDVSDLLEAVQNEMDKIQPLVG